MPLSEDIRAAHLKEPEAPIALERWAATLAQVSKRGMKFCHVYANFKLTDAILGAEGLLRPYPIDN